MQYVTFYFEDMSCFSFKLRELAKGLLPPDVLINHLGEVESIQGQTRTNFVKLDGTIQDTKTKIVQVSLYFAFHLKHTFRRSQVQMADSETRLTVLPFCGKISFKMVGCE